MRTFVRGMCGAAAAFGMTSTALAGIVQVNDPSALNQGPYNYEDFEDDDFTKGVAYSSGSGFDPVRFEAANASGGVTPSGEWGLLSGSFPDTIIMDFVQPMSSGGLWFGNDDTCCSSGFTAYLDLYDANGLVGSLALEANMNDFADQFIGFNSDELITRMVIRFGDGDVGLFVYIDDVYFNKTIPAPAALALLGAGLAVRRRRRA